MSGAGGMSHTIALPSGCSAVAREQCTENV